MFDREAGLVAAACGKGARFADATREDLSALRRAFDSVYASLQRDRQTNGFMREIEAVKASIPADRAIAIPAGCTGSAPGQSTHGNPVAGSWQSGHITKEQWIHAFIAAGGRETEANAAWVQQRYFVITLRFDRSFTEFQSDDGKPAIQGYSATYMIVGDHSLAIGNRTEDAGACVGTYRYQVRGDTLRLRVLKQCAGWDGPYNTALFAAFPFTKSAGPTVIS
jgi:hypothetical protein